MKRRWQGRAPGLWGHERWKRISKLKRKISPLCERCHREGKVVAAQVVHHRIAHNGDPALFWCGLDGLESLCKSCHDGPTRFAEKNGFEKGCDVFGMPLDPRHPWNREGTASNPDADRDDIEVLELTDPDDM